MNNWWEYLQCQNIYELSNNQQYNTDYSSFQSQQDWLTGKFNSPPLPEPLILQPPSRFYRLVERLKKMGPGLLTIEAAELAEKILEEELSERTEGQP